MVLTVLFLIEGLGLSVHTSIMGLSKSICMPIPVYHADRVESVWTAGVKGKQSNDKCGDILCDI